MTPKNHRTGHEIDSRAADRLQLGTTDPAIAGQLTQWDAVSTRLQEKDARKTAVLAMFDGIPVNDQQQPSTGDTI